MLIQSAHALLCNIIDTTAFQSIFWVADVSGFTWKRERGSSIWPMPYCGFYVTLCSLMFSRVNIIPCGGTLGIAIHICRANIHNAESRTGYFVFWRSHGCVPNEREPFLVCRECIECSTAVFESVREEKISCHRSPMVISDRKQNGKWTPGKVNHFDGALR